MRGKIFIGFFIFLFFIQVGRSRLAFANHQVDEIEAALSDAVGGAAKAKLAEGVSEEDQAYGYFLVAVYLHDASARQKSQALYERLNIPDSQAFLGSLEMLKARDWNGGFFQGMFKRKKLVEKGIEKLDAAAAAHPDDPEVRIIRAISYLGLPAFFGKFDEGLAEMERVIQWMESGKIKVPEEEPLFRDRASLYYYAGRYYLKKGDPKKAKEMFIKATASTFHTPFALASRKRIAALS